MGESKITKAGEQFAEIVDGRQRNTINVTDTPQGLCFSCEHAWIWRSTFHNQGRYVIQCQATYNDRLMPEEVNYCNRYAKRGETTLREMKMLATVIDPNDPRQHQAGFLSDRTVPSIKRNVEESDSDDMALPDFDDDEE